MTKPEIIEQLREALKRVPPAPWHADVLPPSLYQARGFTMRPGDQDDSMIIPQIGLEVAALRMGNGGNVVEPWPESNSMIVSRPGVIPTIAEILNLVTKLVDAEEGKTS